MSSKKKPSRRRAEVRLCLLCRNPGEIFIKPVSPSWSSFRQYVDGLQNLQSIWFQNCIKSLCKISEIPSSHPFKHFFLNASYCQDCKQLLRDIDFTVTQLDNFQKQLNGFRQDLNAKIEGNFAAIPSKSKVTAKYEDIVKPDKDIQSKRFSFDEVVKMLHEKIVEKYEDLEEMDVNRGGVCNRNVHNTLDRVAAPLTKKKISKNVSIEPNDNIINEPSDQSDDCGDAGDPDWNCSDDEVMEVERQNRSKTDGKQDVKKNIVLYNSNLSNAEILAQSGLLPTAKHLPCKVDGCTKFFIKESALLLHKRKYHEGDPTPYQCDGCDMKYKSIAGLTTHRSIHKEADTQCLCMICGKIYKSESYLKCHMRLHKDDESFAAHKCKFCWMKFKEEPELIEHEVLHINDTEQSFSCVICKESLTNTIDLRIHVEKVHADKPNICEFCGKRFVRLKNLRFHKKIHDESFKGFKCEVCATVFQDKRGLKRHMIMHSTEKKYTCSVCQLKFKYSSGLHMHMRKHKGEYPFQCKLCDRKFTGGHYLKNHELTHSSVLGYKCTNCQKAFKTRVSLKQHLKTHEPNRIFKKRDRQRKVLDEDLDSEEEYHQGNVPGPSKIRICVKARKEKQEEEELQPAILSIAKQEEDCINVTNMPSFSGHSPQTTCQTGQIQNEYYGMPPLVFEPPIQLQSNISHSGDGLFLVNSKSRNNYQHSYASESRYN